MSTADQTISRTIEALMHYRGVTRADLCRAVNLSSSSYYNRLNGSRAWTAAEVADAARLLGVPVQTLYEGLPGVGAPFPGGMSTVTHQYQADQSCYALAA